jgi:O-antigen/teichoic acid export membrane protein
MHSPSDSEPSAFDAKSLKRESVKGGLIGLAGQAGIFVLRLGSLAVLVRLIDPEGFGLVAMAMTVVTFLTLVTDLGLTEATVQRNDLVSAQVNTLFWINVVAGCGTTFIAFLAAPELAAFYGDERLVSVVQVLSVILLLTAFRVQPRALLQRAMDFSSLYRIEGMSHAGAVAIAISAAVLGAGYWALVLQYAVQNALSSLLIWLVVDWRPERPAVADGWKDLFRFSSHLTGYHLVEYAVGNTDDILIGRYGTAEALGYYANAYKFLLVPIRLIRRPVSGVVLPALSRLQTRPDAFKRYTREALALLASVSMPVTAFAFIEAEHLVALLLGAGWEPVTPLFSILSVVAFMQSVSVVTYWSYVALGQTDRRLRWGIVHGAIAVGAFMIGVQWGATGVALAYAIVTSGTLVPGLMYCFATSPLNLNDVWQSVWRAAIASIGAAGFVWWLSVATEFNALIALTVNVVLFATTYLALWALLPGGFSHLNRISALVWSGLQR